MKSKAFTFFFLIFISVLCIFLSEWVLRIAFEPVDYLRPTLIQHESLGHAIKPGSGHHDDFGFRNPEVPTTTEIIAIGDSMTYGVSATQSLSWPRQLETITEKKVYNLGLGGYGPAHYQYLLREYGLALKPKQVLIGLYLGNDMVDTLSLVYTNQNWKNHRQSSFEPDPEYLNKRVMMGNEHQKFLKKEREWLSQNSMLYQLLKQTFLGRLVRQKETTKASKNNKYIFFDKTNVQTVLDPNPKSLAMDVSQTSVAEGAQLSTKLIAEIKKICDQNQIKLSIVVLPTKEMVYGIAFKEELAEEESIQELIQKENRLRLLWSKTFKEYGISVIDPLPSLVKSLRNKERIYRQDVDTHPIGAGYAIIAKEVALKLK